jgi:hypothetical protein
VLLPFHFSSLLLLLPFLISSLPLCLSLKPCIAQCLCTLVGEPARFHCLSNCRDERAASEQCGEDGTHRLHPRQHGCTSLRASERNGIVCDP